MEAKEMKIGEIRDILTPEGEKIKIQCIEQLGCHGCYPFDKGKIDCGTIHRMAGQCNPDYRVDHTPSIFKEYIDNIINSKDQFVSQHEVKQKEMNMQKIKYLSSDIKTLASISFGVPENGIGICCISGNAYLYSIHSEYLIKELNEAIKPIIEKNIKNLSNILEKETTSDN